MGGVDSGKRGVAQRADTRSRDVIGAAIAVHRALGPGFKESVYEESLCMELHARGIPFERQREAAIEYRGREVGTGTIDILVDRVLVVELKAVDALAPLHTAQVISYLRMVGCPLGILINFNVPVLKEGLRRIALSSSLLE